MGGNNGENRLAEVWRDGVRQAKFTYDGEGRMVKTELTLNGVTTETYRVGEDYELRLTAGVESEVRQYTFGGQRVAQRRNAEAPLYYFTDHLGSTRAAAGTDGAAAGSTDYSPYGEKYPTVAGEAEVEGKVLYTGQRYEELIGLYDYRARWYDPVLGRFIQADTILPNPDDSRALDRYAYGYNNPVKYNDPTGHFAWVLAGALAGAGISYGVQVYNNYQSGYTGSDAWTSNISGEAIVGGALMGAGAVLLAPAAVALVGDAAVGTSLITGSTGLYLAGNSCYQTSAIMEANIVYGAPGNPLPVVKYNPNSASEVIDSDYEAQANGKPSVLTYSNNKATNNQNSKDAMSGYPPRTGYDRHEYPYKSTYEGGKGASVRYVNPGDNRSHGAYLRAFYKEQGLKDGFKFYVDSGFYPWSSLPADYYNAYGYEANNNNQGGGR